MFPLLLLVPGGVLLWVIAQRFAERKMLDEDPRASWGPTEYAYYHGDRRPSVRGALPPARSRTLTAADYLHHLDESIAACRIVDTVKQYAIAGDVQSLMQSSPRVGHAMSALGAPMPLLFAQRDLNVIGADPPVPEDGKMNGATRNALRTFQQKFGLPVTGDVDHDTAFALRYSVGCIHSQDRAEAMGF